VQAQAQELALVQELAQVQASGQPQTLRE